MNQKKTSFDGKLIPDAESDSVVYIDLTKYDGDWPPPRDYGLSKAQWERYKSNQKIQPFRMGLFVWLFPLLTFVLPANVLSDVAPLRWFVDLMGYIFPVIQAAGLSTANGQILQLTLALILFGILVYAPYDLNHYSKVMNYGMNLSRYSFLMRIARSGAVQMSPKGYRQLFNWMHPLAMLIFAWIIGCDIAGYVALYLLHIPISTIANWHLGTGGIISGAGWIHGVVHSYVSSDRPKGFSTSRMGMMLEAFGVESFVAVELIMATYSYKLHQIGGFLTWRRQLIRESKHFEQLKKEKRS